MKRRAYLAAAALVSLLCINTGAAFAAPVSTEKDGDRLIQKYVFYSDSISNVNFNEAREKIEHDGKEYELTDISYEKIGRRAKVKKVVDKSSRNYPKTADAENYKGEKVTLTAQDDVHWEKIVDAPLTKTVEYTGNQTIPDKITIEKNGMSVDAAKTDSQLTNKTSRFSAPAVFIGEAGDEYYFNGRYVTVGKTPSWPGYEKDVRDYLDDSSIKSIDGGSWKGRPYRRADGKLVRRAEFYGSRITPVTKVTYTENKSSRTHYRAEIVYLDPDEDGEYVVRATCTYKLFEDTGLALKVLAGAGVFVIAAAIAAGLVYLATRKRMKKDRWQLT